MPHQSVIIPWDPRDYAGVIAAFGTVLALVLSNLWNKRTLAASRLATETALWQKANEAELTSIQDKLDAFFAPLMQRSNLNFMLSSDLRARQKDSETFLLLEKLIDPVWRAALPDGEKALVVELVANAKDIREFIRDHGAVNEKLIPYLARASAHYRILELAAENKLGADPAPWIQHYVYPKAVDAVLRLEMERLQQRAAVLRSNPGKAPPLPTELFIPSGLALKEWVDPPRKDRPELTLPV